MMGTIKTKPLVIGKRRSPRCFKGVKKNSFWICTQCQCLDGSFYILKITFVTGIHN
jgi:hypothetical protein